MKINPNFYYPHLYKKPETTPEFIRGLKAGHESKVGHIVGSCGEYDYACSLAKLLYGHFIFFATHRMDFVQGFQRGRKLASENIEIIDPKYFR